MKLLFIGDMHLKISKFDLSKSFLDWINEIVKLHKPDLIVNLGDTFDTHAVLRSEIMAEFMDHVHRCIEIAPYVYLLGNHDLWKPSDSKYHALKHMKGMVQNFTIVDEIKEIADITFVPYIHNPADFPLQTSKICVAHQTFKGADYGDITTKDGVDADAVSAEIIISGHIHKKQVLGKVIYPGSPFSQSLNDINQIKGVMLFDTKTYKQTLIECPLPKWVGAKFDISPVFSCEDLQVELKNLLDSSEDHWVFEITGPKAEITAYLDSKQAKKLFAGKSIKIKTVFTDKEKKLTKIKALSVDSIVNEYINKVYSGSLDKDQLQAKSMELLAKL